MQSNMNLLLVSPLGSARGFGGGGIPVCANFAFILFHWRSLPHAYQLPYPLKKRLLSAKVTTREVVWQRRQTDDMTVGRADCLFPELINWFLSFPAKRIGLAFAFCSFIWSSRSASCGMLEIHGKFGWTHGQVWLNLVKQCPSFLAEVQNKHLLHKAGQGLAGIW